jgi:hypothetical protein
MTTVGYTKTLKPVRDWSQRIWRLLFDQQLEITRGRVDGAYPVVIDGHLVTTGAATNVLILEGSTIKDPSVAPAAGLQMSIVSTSAQDSAAGTGIRSIVLNYLDADLMPHSETITLNGTTPVLTTATNIRWVGEIHLHTYGSGKAFAGNLTVTNGGTRYKFISAGSRTTRSSAYRVPAGKRLIIHTLYAGAHSGTSATGVTIDVVASRINNESFADAGLLITQGTIALQDSSVILSDGALYAIPAGEIVALRATTDKAATVTGGFYGWLEDAD